MPTCNTYDTETAREIMPIPEIKGVAVHSWSDDDYRASMKWECTGHHKMDDEALASKVGAFNRLLGMYLTVGYPMIIHEPLPNTGAGVSGIFRGYWKGDDHE